MQEKTDKKMKWMTIGSGILVFILYFVLSYSQILPFQLLHIDTNSLPKIVKVLYLIAYEVLTILIITSILGKKLEQDWKDMKKNHKEYFSTYIKYWFLILFLMMLSNSIILLINHGKIANNEESIRTSFKLVPIYTFLSAVFYAPIVEELTFRQAIRNIFKNDFIFVLISGLIFGSLHVLPTYKVPLDLLYIIPYSIPGWIFAYTLKKSNNIFVPMGIHFLHNGILMSLQFLLFFLS